MPHDVVEDDRGNRRRGTDRRQAKPTVSVFTHWIVNAADDLRHIEDQPGYLSGHDVSIVAIGDRDERIRRFDPCLTQDIFVDPGPDDRFASETRRKPAKGPAISIDHGHSVSGVIEQPRDPGAHSATTHDHDIHRLAIGAVPGRPGTVLITTTSHGA